MHDFCEAQSWDRLEAESGLKRVDMQEAAAVYARANAVMGVYGMGLTQHRHGVTSVQMLVNLLLLRGNIGRPGAGICPVRGHSNVQGQRTVGISEKPQLVPLDRLAELYGFEPPREEGLTTVDACELPSVLGKSAGLTVAGRQCSSSKRGGVPRQTKLEPLPGRLVEGAGLKAVRQKE